MISVLTSILDPTEQALISRKGGSYLLTFSFDLGPHDFLKEARIQDYWAGRWFELKSTPVGGLYGTRGGLFGNLFACDIRKILTELLIEFEGSTVHSRLRLDFRYQIMSEWNLVEYKLEQLLFRTALLQRHPPPTLLQMQQARLASQLAWVLAGKLERFPAEFLEDVLALTDGGIPQFQVL